MKPGPRIDITPHLLILAMALTVGFAAHPAQADFIYGVDWTTEDHSIFTLDTETGELTKYYGHPVNDICGIDLDSSGTVYILQTSALYRVDLFNPLNNELIAYNADWVFESFEIVGDVGYTAHVFDGTLLTIDLTTGETKVIGIYGNAGTRFTGLASDDEFAPAPDDTLYAARVWQQDIVTVDATTATVLDTVSAHLGYGMVNLAYGSNNSLWFVDSSEATLNSVDIATGQVTVVKAHLELVNITGLTAVPEAPAPGPQIITTSLPDGVVGQPYGPVPIKVVYGEYPLQWILVPYEYEEFDLGLNGYGWRGEPQGWYADNGAWIHALPFEFPFYGATYQQIWICSNGFIDLDGPATDPDNSDEGLMAAKRICPLWDDLATNYGGRDIYIDESVADEVTVFWNVYRPQNSIPCYFQCTLHASGEIEFHYGPRNEAVTPTVGISNGDSLHYEFSMYNGQTDLEYVNSVRFTPQVLPAELTFDENAVISGTPVEAGIYDLEVRVIDSLQRSDTALLTLIITPDPTEVETTDPWLEIPGTLILSPNQPNPFNPVTRIAFAVPVSAPVTLTVYNLQGVPVVRLVDDVLDTGWHVVSWDGTDDLGRQVPSGVYLYRLESGSDTITRRMLLLK